MRRFLRDLQETARIAGPPVIVAVLGVVIVYLLV